MSSRCSGGKTKVSWKPPTANPSATTLVADLGADFVPFDTIHSSHFGMQGKPPPIGKLRAEPAVQVERFADVERHSIGIAQDVDTR